MLEKFQNSAFFSKEPPLAWQKKLMGFLLGSPHNSTFQPPDISWGHNTGGNLWLYRVRQANECSSTVFSWCKDAVGCN